MGKPHSLVVGGTRGLGRVLAEFLAGEGHSVSILGRTAPAAKTRGKRTFHYWSVDLSNQKRLIPVLNAVIQSNGPLSSLVLMQRYKESEHKWEGEIETSLTASRCIIDHLIDKFQERSARSIVLVSSAASQVVAEEQPVGYHVAKAGINQLARYYAAVLGPLGIRVNTVSPGTILKPENQDFYSRNPKLQKLFKQVIPLGRMGTAKEVAQVIAFLCSSKASFITGQNILVDGGVSVLSQETLARKLASTLRFRC